MPRKAVKCVVEVDIHAITCPGTFLRDYEYVYIQMEMLGLEGRTSSVSPTFPLFFHQRLRFEKTFPDCSDPGLVLSLLKLEDVVIELRQHRDYIAEGKVIAHCSSNTHTYFYPAIPPNYGSGREIILYKTSKFKPIRITGESVKMEFTTKTVIKEVADNSGEDRVKVGTIRSSPIRRSASPSPVRSGKVPTVSTTALEKSLPRHVRSYTTPLYSSTLASLKAKLAQLHLEEEKRRARNYRYRTYTSPNLVKALNSSKRIQMRVDDMMFRKSVFESDLESDIGLDVLRESLREERNTLNDVIAEADKEAFYRSLNKTY